MRSRESLRRETQGTGVEVMHLVTPGVRTDMLDATEDVYGRHMETEDWPSIPPEEWAAKVVKAMRVGDHVVGPGGRLALAKLASRGPAAVLDAFSARMFTPPPARLSAAAWPRSDLHDGDPPLGEARLAVAR